MANPAGLLHRQLSAWRNDGNYADLTQQRIAVRHIEAVAELLDQMDDARIKTTIFRRHFDAWVALTSISTRLAPQH